jgi:hypothetical protein
MLLPLRHRRSGVVVARELKYADAVRLLGGRDSTVVAALDAITGGLILAGATVVPPLLGWLEAKNEVVRLSGQLIARVREKRAGLGRYTRA